MLSRYGRDISAHTETWPPRDQRGSSVYEHKADSQTTAEPLRILWRVLGFRPTRRAVLNPARYMPPAMRKVAPVA